MSSLGSNKIFRCIPIDDSEENDQVQLLTHPRLVNANEIIVEQPTVLEHARPILTASERLKRTDQIILRALLEKRAILTEFLPGVDVCFYYLFIFSISF